ncbi:hypothetical protein HGRIS_010832 [Hohenbuehelia grisea]|uniref:Uncharacterized protein n=1 Tax=Hohenbuehelia grisea TaxID=104357 RepID=A0ABR3IXZ4_9AGAR
MSWFAQGSSAGESGEAPVAPAVTPGRELQGRIALITGSTGGIGRATAVALARRGCAIAVHYHTARDKADALVLLLTGDRASSGSADQPSQVPVPVPARAFQADLGDYDAVRRLHAEVTSWAKNLSTHGNEGVQERGIDVLFNNGAVTGPRIGGAGSGNIEDLSIEAFESTWRANVGASFLLTQLCIPHMVQQHFGRIIFCSSVAAATGGVVGPHYASSKSALHGLLHWLAPRYARDGLTVNAVAPALIIETEMNKDPSPEWRNLIPVGRFGMPAEVAACVELLATNGYMTNKILVVDGGATSSAF